jgi:hypothetical protein
LLRPGLSQRSRLELEAARELNNTRLEGSEKSSERITVDVCLCELVSDREVASIQDIERLNANLKARVLGDANVLD